MTMRVVTFKIDERALIELDKYANRNGLSRSEVIRMAIEKFIENEKKKKVFTRVSVSRIRIF